MELMEHQKEVIHKLGNGKILYGEVGSGKSTAVLAYYIENEEYRDIVVITTARKRDAEDWIDEAASLGIGTEVSCYGRLTVDSWNNISKYEDVTDCFFVFDEQRVVGHGAWVRSFIKITKGRGNHWVLLSATPGDTWLDYAPVFIANGFYKNITHFKTQHVRYEPYIRYPKVKEYLNVERLEELRNEILVEMPYLKHTTRMLNWWPVSYDKDLYKRIWKERWNIYDHQPIKDAAERWKLARRCVNSDPSRINEIRHLLQTHPRLIVFYNFNYELEILRGLDEMASVYEWNGHKKDDHKGFENEEQWIYLVQYTAGAEAWNCTSTDAMVMYSLNYSYRLFEQVQGRIDRLNTPFTILYYYIFFSDSFIDRSIRDSLEKKESFNEKKAIQESDKSDRFEEEIDVLEQKYRFDDQLEVCQI